MFNRSFPVLVAVAALISAPISFAYDKTLAASYASLFEPVAGAKAGKELHLMPPNVLVEKVKRGQQVLALDIRTEKETGLFTMSIPGSKSIPINKLFIPENLDQLPSNKPIVIVCKSGIRATAAGTALRHIGFENV